MPCHRGKKHHTPAISRIRPLKFIRVIFDVKDSDEPRFILEIYDHTRIFEEYPPNSYWS